MKRFYLLAIVLISIINVGVSQNIATEITGKVLSQQTELPLEGIQVNVDGKIYYTDKGGIFIVKKEATNENASVIINEANYQRYSGKLVNHMVIKLKASTSLAGEIALSMNDLDSDAGESMSTPGLLFSSGDAYSSMASYSWGPYWFRQRGYQSNYNEIYFDGVKMANPEKGYASWSLWGGLNDVTRNKEVTYNIAPVDFSFSSIGGATNIISKPSQQRPGLKGSYSYGNSSYHNRLMLTYSTGLMDNGWAISASISRRWAQEGFIDGTHYDAYAAYLGIEKQISSKHSLQFTAFVAPYSRGYGSSSVKEVYDLTGNHYYNSYWGYQNGDKRNSRVKTSILPQFILHDEYKFNDNMTLKTSLGYSFGKEARTALNWFDASDPRPDYYRYLPSYQYAKGNTAAGDLMTEMWKSGEYGQLSWNYFYQVNQSNMTTFQNVRFDQNLNAIPTTSVTGNRSHYIIEKRQTDIQNIDFNPTFIWDLTDTWNLTTGLQYEYYNGNSYNTVDDLLGGDFYVDIDNFADRDFPNEPHKVSNDLMDTTQTKYKGDRIGHDYDANINKLGYWANISKSFENAKTYLGVNVSNTSMYRFGNRQKGLFPYNSYGKSDVLSFTDYGVKLGGEYYITGRNVLALNTSFYTQAPYFQDAFVSVRTRNDAVKNLVSSKVLSADLNYYYRGERFKFRSSAFYTRITDLTDVISYYDDSYNNFVNYVLTGIGQEYTGVEIGAEYQLNDAFKIKGAGTVASYTYTDNPLATVTVDNSADVLRENEVVYYTGRDIGGSPQLAGALSLEYYKHYWRFSITGNYLGNRSVTLNPARYTQRAIYVNPDVSNPILRDNYEAILHQEKLADAFTVDISAGKSWRIKGHYLSFNLNVSNILNNEDIVTTGYQQYRFDFKDGNPEKFANKYYFAQGVRVFANLSFSL